MSAYQAILEAPYARTKTGEGSAIEISMFQSVAEWMNVLLRRNDVAKINLHCKTQSADYTLLSRNHPASCLCVS